MCRYTGVREVRGERLDATYRKFCDVTIVRAKSQCDYYATAYLPGGYMLTDMSYTGYTWDEVKRLFKQAIEDEVTKVIMEARTWA